MKVYLVDCSGYIFRAFYAVQHLTNREGFPTNALFGFVRMFIKLLEVPDATHVVCVFDAGRATFRTEIYPEYKANRTECPEELAAQMPYFREITRALGLSTLELPGFEADDIIATLTRRLDQAGYEVCVVTADKDLMQLVSDRVSLWDTMRDRHVAKAQVVEKFGVPPNQVVEVLGLMGDDSDNVPGLAGVGPKTAAQLVQRYGTTEQILESIDRIAQDKEIRGRASVAEKLRSGAEILRVSRRLVEVVYDVPARTQVIGQDGQALEISISESSIADLCELCLRRPVEEAKLRALFERFDFGSLLKELRLAPPRQPESTSYAYHLIRRPDFASFCAKFLDVKAFAFDIETTGFKPQDATIVGLSLCWSNDEAFYIPVAHDAEPESNVPWADIIAKLGPVFASNQITKIGQNIRFDLGFMQHHGLAIDGPLFDTMVASWLLAPDKPSHNLSVLARNYLARTLIEFEEVLAGAADFRAVPPAAAAQYGGQDAHVAWCVRPMLQEKLVAAGVAAVFSDIEMPLVPVLARMENAGVKIDIPALRAMSEEYAQKISDLELKIQALAGEPVNSNSPKQLSRILFEKLALPTKGLKRTKTGISTDSSVLERLQSLHPLPAALLEYRALQKLKGTYLDALPEQVSPTTGRLHSRFNQTGTGTGRLSSNDPNLQNIPVRTSEGQRIRMAFIAEADCSLISADYSQIELRLLAHMSADPALCQAFIEDQDIHAATAREIGGVPADAPISDELRRAGKTINFGIVYGMSAYRLSRELSIPVAEAQRYIDSYFARYPKVQEYFAGLEAQAMRDGYVTTLFGRKRTIADIDTQDRDSGFLMRAALNAPIQGSAADLIKIAMVRLDGQLRNQQLAVRLIMQVHDELVFECPNNMLDRAMNLIRHEMEEAVSLSVPLKVSIGAGPNWHQAQA